MGVEEEFVTMENHEDQARIALQVEDSGPSNWVRFY